MEKIKYTKEEWNIKREDLMTRDEMKEIDTYLCKIIQNRGEMEEYYSRWEEEEKAYKGDQEKVKNRPNTRVNIINCNIEGQIAGIIEQNLAITTRGESPADQFYSDWARIGLDWTFRKNRIKKVLESHERRRLKFGSGIFKVYFDEESVNGYGLTKICVVPNNKIFIDTAVKEHLNFQDASYIVETVRINKDDFDEIYGEEKTSVVNFGQAYIENTTIFSDNTTMDDLDSVTVIYYWCRHKGKLRLMEFTGDGILLYDSHKKGDRKTNQKNSAYDHKSYYKNVNNKYPYFFTNLYTVEGELWGFGDIKLLMPLQDMLNDLYDKIRIAARPNLILFDPSSEVDLEDFDENSMQPRPAMLNQKAVDIVPWGQVNPALWQLIASVHQEAQRIIRFSNLMIGQGNTSETATEASIQQQQGNSTTDQKKQILQETLVEMCEYILGIMMEKYTGAKAFRIADDKDEYEWIDFRKLGQVPAMKKATAGFKKQYKDKREEGEQYEEPQWEIITDDKGNPATKNVDLDIEISIGAGLPKNKSFLWQMIQRLGAMVVLDQNGMQHNLISYEELRKFLKEFIGLPLEDKDMNELMQQPMIGQQPTNNAAAYGTGTMQSADSPLTANGNVATGQLPQPMMGGMPRG